MANETKCCSKCKTFKPVERFYRSKRYKDGRFCWCRDCVNESAAKNRQYKPGMFRERDRRYREKRMIGNPRFEAEHYQRYKRLYRNRNLRVNYGITISTFEELIKKQHGRCAICLVEFSDKHGERAVVDHCHEIGFIRGILCRNCNSGIGLFKDSSAILRRAAEYVDQIPTSGITPNVIVQRREAIAK